MSTQAERREWTSAWIKGIGRQDQQLEELVARLSLEAGVSSVSWAIRTPTLE
jgi:hypothetical protein